MSKERIDRALRGANTEKTRRITNISPIRGREIVIIRLSGMRCPECQEQKLRGWQQTLLI